MRKSRFSRREFMKYGMATATAHIVFPSLAGCGKDTGKKVQTSKVYAPVKSINTDPGIVLVQGGSPQQLVQRAMKELGGMERFVKKNDRVFLKPNMSWDRPPECAANTNPLMVAEVVKMCLNAGAKEVLVLDRTCNEPRRCYKNSRIEHHARQAGAKVRHVMDSRFKSVAIPNGTMLKSWRIYKDVLDVDVFISMPVAKHHGLARVSLAVKNLMGLLGGNRGQIHENYPEKIVDIASILKPDLVIIDAYRMLLANGPQGGNLQDVRLTQTVIAGTNQVSVDALGVTLFGLKPEDFRYLQIAQKRALGETSLQLLPIKIIQFKG